MGLAPRVAFFTDTFQEINGVALTSRQLTSFAQRRGYPFLCVRGAKHTKVADEGSVRHVELRRGPLSFELDRGLLHDPFLWRSAPLVRAELDRFRPDIIHVVSPGDVSEIGAWMAKKRKLPLAISWHTNLHEFGAMRLAKMLGWLPFGGGRAIAKAGEWQILEIVLAFYRMGNVLYAPNPELVEMLKTRTGKPVFLMTRGIDTQLFTPERRTAHDGIARLGYVGRITPEKSVRFLKTLETALLAKGVPPFRFLVVGDGSEKGWLTQNLASAEIPGILRGAELANAYANMDIFVFPSKTDTFGNVVLEAFASGVPAVVTDSGGPRFIVREGQTGFVGRTDSEMIEHVTRLLTDPVLRHRMAAAAREQAQGESWDAVFDSVYAGYQTALHPPQRPS
jgi:glycosyltransferase involved in cell wall biosynthesis